MSVQDNPSPTLVVAPEPSLAREPFNDPLADVILRSSNSIDFYLHKNILSIASPFFKDMFSLAQPTSMTASQDDAPPPTEIQPIIPVSEDETTLDRMLRLTYPVVEPAPGTFDEVARVLEASLKYQIEKVSIHMKAALLTFAQSEPVQVYGVACRLELEHEASVAARLWKPNALPTKSPCGCDYTARSCGCGRANYRRYRDARGNFLTCGCPEAYGLPSPPSDFQLTTAAIGFNVEMERITAGSYFRLLQYIRTRVESSTFCWPAVEAAAGSVDANEDVETYVSYFLSHANADLIIQSGDGIQFRVHRLFLSVASAHRILDRCSEEGEEGGGLPVAYLDDPGATLGCLLRLCYPFPEDLDLSIAQLARVRVVAEKYNIPGVVAHTRRLMMEEVESHPLEVYFLSKRHGWQADAEEATTECLRLESIYDMYSPEMEASPSRVYYDLLEAHFNRSIGPDSREGAGSRTAKTKRRGRR